MTTKREGKAIQIEGLVVRYGDRQVIDHLSLEVGAGEVYGLLGGNGAGKSTTLQAILGFVTPSAGRVRVVGLDPSAEPAAVRRAIAYIPENVALYDHLSARENVDYFLSLKISFLIVTHDLIGVADIADRVGFLEKGRISDEMAAEGADRFDLRALHDRFARARAA